MRSTLQRAFHLDNGEVMSRAATCADWTETVLPFVLQALISTDPKGVFTMKVLDFKIVKISFVIIVVVVCLLAQDQSRFPRSQLVFHGKNGSGTWPARNLHPCVLPDGRMVVAISDTIYMIDADGKQLWKFEKETLASEPAFNSAQNEIALVMHDLQGVRLDATTGRVKWQASSVGRALFTSVSAYEQGFLVLIDMGGYRKNGNPKTPDRLEYWGESERSSWSIDFPVAAELVVNGRKIYALERAPGELRLLELHPPR